MIKTALDSSVLVAALLSPHAEHDSCRAAVNEALAGDTVVPQSTLIETFAILTRLPPPLRLRPHDAAALLQGTLEGAARVTALSPAATWKLLSVCGQQGAAGGSVYDRRILAEARAGGAVRLLTLNPKDFSRGDALGIEIVDPSMSG